MQNPMPVVLTDRNELDDQHFGQLQHCTEYPPRDAGAGQRAEPLCADEV